MIAAITFTGILGGVLLVSGAYVCVANFYSAYLRELVHRLRRRPMSEFTNISPVVILGPVLMLCGLAAGGEALAFLGDPRTALTIAAVLSALDLLATTGLGLETVSTKAH